MGLSHSSSIVTNGLVFAYDMANTKKSWKGRPVTNQFTLPTADVNGFGVQNSTFTRVRTGNYGGYEILPSDYVWRYNVSGNDCPYHGWDIPTTAGDVVTFSFDYYVDPSTSNYPITNYLANIENTGSGVSGSYADPTPSIKGVWKRAYFSSTATATGNSRCLLYPGACGGRLGDAGFILYKNPQVEFNAPGSIPTPFVAGTRYANNNLETTPSYPTWGAGASSASGGTLTFAAGSYNSKSNWDLYKQYTGLTSSVNYTWSALVKLGTATNLLVTMNNTQSWNTGPSAQFSSELSTSEFRRISITGSTSTGQINLHLGASYNTELASTVQTGGTVFIKDVRLELTGSSSTLRDLTDNNTITANSLTYNSDGTFSFDGSTNYITLGSDVSLLQTSQITIEAWVKTNVVGSYKKIFTNGNATGVYLSIGPSPNNTYFGVVTNGTSGSATWTTDISTSAYTHMVGTYDGTICRLYVNGEEKATGAASGTMGTGSTIYISGYANGSERWNGLIPIVRVYDRPLAAVEVKKNFSALRGRYGI